MSGGIRPSSPIFLLNGSNSIMSQHVCVCLSILQAKPDLTLLGSPAGLADVARDPCDPVTSTVMIRLSVCAAARWGVAALAASFPPALPGPWVMFGPEAEAGRRGFINSAEAWWAGKLLTFNVFRRAKENKKAQHSTLISQMANGQSLYRRTLSCLAIISQTVVRKSWSLLKLAELSGFQDPRCK